MKQINLIYVLLTLSAPSFYAKQEEFKIILEPKWENLEHDTRRIAQFGGKWI